MLNDLDQTYANQEVPVEDILFARRQLVDFVRGHPALIKSATSFEAIQKVFMTFLNERMDGKAKDSDIYYYGRNILYRMVSETGLAEVAHALFQTARPTILERVSCIPAIGR
jgi:hypothetical protein